MQQQKNHEYNDDEISVSDILLFLKGHIKYIVYATLIGAAFGLISFFQIGRFSATAVLMNDGLIDFVLLKRLQSELPRIAEFSNETKKEVYLTQISNDEWWKKNFKPTYAITKTDVKDFELNSKDNRIVSFTLNTNDNSEDGAREKLTNIVDFFKHNSSLVIIKDLFQRYKIDVETKASELAKNEQAALVEINYMKVKAKNLEELKGRFQQNSSVISSQFLDPKESGSKYLPINTQLIALYADMAAQNEAIERIKDEKSILAFKNKIHEKFEASLNDGTNGFVFLNNVREEVKLEIKNILGNSQEDMRKAMALKGIESEIASIQSRFKSGLSERTPIQINKNSFAKNLGMGSIIGLILGLIFSFGNQLRKKYFFELEHK